VKTLLTIIVSALVFGGAAFASEYRASAVTPAQVSALTARVTKLEGQVKTLQKATTTVTQVIATCLDDYVPVTDYGDATGNTFGYTYNPGGGGAIYPTTALDVTDSSQTPQWRLVAFPKACNGTSLAAGG